MNNVYITDTVTTYQLINMLYVENRSHVEYIMLIRVM